MSTVLHVGKFYPPVQGGMERVVQTLCRASKGLVESRVLALNAGRSTVHETVEGIDVTRAGTLLTAGSVPVAPALASCLRREQPDAIVLHEPNPWALVSYAIARPRAPLVLWYHSDVVRPALQYALFYAPLARVVYSRAVRIVVSSPPLAAHAKPLAPYGDRIRVIPFGIEPGAWQRTTTTPEQVVPSQPFVLFAGRHVAYKGVDVLLRALQQVHAHAVIVGDGPKRLEWEQLARDLDVSARVTFTGDVDDDALKGWMQRATAFVLPSVTRAEAFGYVQLEAMAAGVPVISTDVPSGVSWVNRDGETGLIVKAGDAAALARAIATMVSSPQRRQAMSAAARQRVCDEFTVERLRERLRALYEELALVRPFPSSC